MFGAKRGEYSHLAYLSHLQKDECTHARPAGILHPCSTFWVASAAPRLATLSNNSSFSHASQRVQYILTKEHWLNINIAPEAGNGPRLAGFSGVLSPLSVCRTPLPPVNKNISRQREVSHFSPLLSKTSMRNRWHLFDAFVRAR